jgi:hypothetical protein
LLLVAKIFAKWGDCLQQAQAAKFPLTFDFTINLSKGDANALLRFYFRTPYPRGVVEVALSYGKAIARVFLVKRADSIKYFH